MGISPFLTIKNTLVVCILFTLQIFCAASEELVPTKPAPFHNLIPRFKMPPGNLLRYDIPHWEILYFLKHGIVPFIFYDPHFNRTNFITQVHKFKMYFDDGRPNRTSYIALKDNDSFREFLRKHGYPNHNQLPEDALSRNNKMVEEINGLLRAAGNSQTMLASNEKDALENEKGDLDPTFQPLLKAIIEDLDNGRHSTTEEVTIGKRTNSSSSSEHSHKKGRQKFWSTLITKYPLSWKYTRSVVGTRNLLLNQASSWMPERFPHSTFGRNAKSFRIGTRNVNMDSEGGDADGIPRANGASESRKGGKTFQTQGW